MPESEKSARLFGERLKALRKKMELKQSVLAHSIGISEDTLSLIERGLASPRLDMLCKIAEQLKMTLSQLVDFQDESKAKQAVNQPLATHMLYLKAKSPDEIKMVHDAVRSILDQAPAIYQKPRRSSKRRPFTRSGFSLREPVRVRGAMRDLGLKEKKAFRENCARKCCPPLRSSGTAKDGRKIKG